MSLLKTARVVAAATVCGLVLGLQPAAAIGPQAAAGATITADSLVTQVHRGHGANCAYGKVPRWGTRTRHRHVNGNPRKCGKRHRGSGRPDRWDKRGCWQIGPVWYCP